MIDRQAAETFKEADWNDPDLTEEEKKYWTVGRLLTKAGETLGSLKTEKKATAPDTVEPLDSWHGFPANQGPPQAVVLDDNLVASSSSTLRTSQARREVLSVLTVSLLGIFVVSVFTLLVKKSEKQLAGALTKLTEPGPSRRPR